MRIPLLAAFLLLVGAGLYGCDSFVEGIDDPIDRIPSEALNDPSQVPFLITGVEHRYNTVNGAVSVSSSNLSDQFIFDTCVQNATFPTFDQLDRGQILLDNNTIRNIFRPLGELRFIADDLIDRAENQITFGEGQEDLRTRALYTGNLYGGLARHIYATFFGLTETQGGGVINVGPFIPSSEMYADAIARMETARGLAASDAQVRLVNSLIARSHLYNGNYEAALAAALNGMVEGDAPFQTLYIPSSANPWFSDGGRGRTQIVANQRFFEAQDPRAPVEPAPMRDVAGCDVQRYRQAVYPTNATPITNMSWQETNLMIAEALLRTGGDSGEALARLNANRAAVDTDDEDFGDLDDISLDIVESERDFQLFAQGQRLPDQRRFGTFHLPDGRWQFFPIPSDERNSNPNL